MCKATAIVQARTGSTRLPGKTMYPLDGIPMLVQILRRLRVVTEIDNIVVATSVNSPDRIIELVTQKEGCMTYRGSEKDVLQRFNEAAETVESKYIVRVNADCPLLSPQLLSNAIQIATSSRYDYISTLEERTFPRGINAEVFTRESLQSVCDQAEKPHYREHVTPYYRESKSEFDTYNINSTEVYDKPWMQDRTDLRFTVDEPSDYWLINQIYTDLGSITTLDTRSVVCYVDESDLNRINEGIDQKQINRD